MTADEEALLKETEKVVNEAGEQMNKRHTREHQKMMPHFSRYAKELVAESDSDPNGIHLFVIQTSNEGREKADNPLGLTGDSFVGEFHKYFTFSDLDEARELMTQMPASVLFNEFMKQQHGMVALYIQGNHGINMMYCQGKLTVHRQLPNGDSVTDTADIRKEQPDPFFERVSIDQKHRMLATALVFLTETGKVAEANTPGTYKLMVKRLKQSLEQDDE